MAIVRSMCGDDWEGLFIDGRLVAENHTLDLLGLLRQHLPNERIGIEIKTVYIEDEEGWNEYGCHCPQEWTVELEKMAK